MTSNEEDLLKLLKRLQIRGDAVGVAAFLNQKYPDKHFNPIGLGFSPELTSRIPIAFKTGDKTEIVHVFPETFGQICYGYWSRELGVGEFKRRNTVDEEPDK